MRVLLGVIAIVAATAGAARDATAGGMMLPVRGVRTVERAGALIAGADDADALWLDPAGLAHLAGDGKTQLLFDAAFVYQAVDYARIDASGARLPVIHNQQPGQLLPTIAATLGVGDRLVLAGGLTAAYAGVHRYADDGPQRYASISFDSPAFVYVTVGAAYRLSDRLRIGATLTDVVSKIDSRIAVSLCPAQATCTAEDPAYEAQGHITQTDYIAPSGSIGVQYDAAPIATLGLAFQAPSRVSASGELGLALPGSPQFSGAQVVGNSASLSFTLPAVIRAGVELHPSPSLRIEAALDAELWSMHDAIDLTPHGIAIARTGGSDELRPAAVARSYRTSFAPAIGVEWHGPAIMLGAGYSYETAAAPPGNVSVLTVDAAKHVLGVGGGYEADGWQIGASAGLALLTDVNVSLADAKVSELTLLREQPSTAINAGSYQSYYVIAGIRFARAF